MKRRALIIGAPGDGVRNTYLSGVEIDVSEYRRYLMSPLGGAWRADEIVTLDSPSEARLITEIERLAEADYSFTTFSGHGFHESNKNSTHVEIQPHKYFDAALLRDGAPKHTLVLDCCRAVETLTLLEASMDSLVKKAQKLDPSDCRRYFDERISQCAKGLVELNACSIGESALDLQGRGGLYSSSLIRGAIEWELHQVVDTAKKYRIFSVSLAHSNAEKAVRSHSRNRQNPLIDQPRSEKQFPFGIIA